MKTKRFLHLFTTLTIFALTLFSFASPALAKERNATVGTTLTIQPPGPVSVGNPAFITVQLISSKGEPVVDQPVELFVDGERLRRSRTDQTGTASIRVTREVAGVYSLTATFKGSKQPSLGSSRAVTELVVSPAIVEVIVTPALPDIKFSLDDRIFASDEYGVARIEVEKAGKYQLDILPVETKDEDIQMSFGRWGDEEFEPSREIEVPLKKPLEVGFEVSYQVSQNFVDLDDQPVDSSRISSITYRGSNGATFTFDDTDTHWMPAGRIIRLNNGLEESKILYSVMSIEIDGANVVSQAQQRFYVDPDDLWTIQVLLYSAHFTARDALFGFPIGTGIEMEYPDGDVQTYTFNTDQSYTIDGLARGIYKVTVIGAEGYAPPTPIALSRSQDVELMVFSYIDMGVLLSIGFMLSLGLLLFGRPHLFTQMLTLPYRVLPGKWKAQSPRLAAFYENVSAFEARLMLKKGIVRPEDNSGFMLSSEPEAYPFEQAPMGLPEMREAWQAEQGEAVAGQVWHEEPVAAALSQPIDEEPGIVIAQEETPIPVADQPNVSDLVVKADCPEQVSPQESADTALDVPAAEAGNGAKPARRRRHKKKAEGVA